MAKNPSLRKEDKNPEGGLSAKGRAKLQAAGQDIKPGVKGKDGTLGPTELRRKGSFLRRHYAGPNKPLKDESGEPTRHALQANAWGEPVPTTQEAADRLAEKGKRLLEKYERLTRKK